MLYHLHEMQNAAMMPWRLAAEANTYFLRSPYNPVSFTPGGRALAAASDIFERNTRPYGKPAFGLRETEVDGRKVRVRERDVLQRPFCHLKYFKRFGSAFRHDPKILLVAPMSGHHATLLRGTVEALLPNHRVFVTDWRDARDVPLPDGPFDLDDYIDYLVGFLEFLGPSTTVMAVCQPSVPVLAAVSLMAAADHPCTPAAMVLMGGPIDTRRNPTAPNNLAQSRSLAWFENTVTTRVPLPYLGFMRRVYPGFLQLTGFMTINLDRHVGAQMKHFQHLIQGDGDSAQAHRDFYDEYLSVMDLPAEFYLQTIQKVFQEHQLPRGVLTSRGRPVDPSRIRTTALMTVEGELDDISGLGQTQAAQDLCSAIPDSRRLHYVQKGVGHYGVFNGRRWRGEIAPRIAAFIRGTRAGH
ncbi:MAG: polyhydroxyalkanoate depolymerase [Sneathiellaceae bacterium]